MVLLSDVLGDPGLRLVPLHVSAPETPVRWVATSELEDPAPFLEGGEILLTTGLNARGWRAEWRPYVERLVASGVAALGLGTGLTHPRAPRSLLGACRDHGLDLFEVPRETTFVSISRVTASLLDDERQSTTRATLRMHRELTQAALRPDEPARLLDRLASFVDGAVCTLSTDGDVRTGPFGTFDWDFGVLADEVARLRPQGLRAASTVSRHGGTTVVQPVGLRGRPDTYLAIGSRRPLDEATRSAVVTTVALLGLAAESRAERRHSERRLSARAYELLLHGDPHGAAIVLAAGTEHDALTAPDRLQVLRATGSDDALDQAMTILEDGGGCVALRRAEDELQAVVVPGNDVEGRLARAGLRVGLGGVVGVDEMPDSHHEAGNALRRTSDATPLVAWQQMISEGFLALVDAAGLTSFARTYLAPLAGATELLDTLGAFLRRHGSVGAAARELGVHRNTVRNRVEDIEARLERSLDDPQTRADAWLALQGVARATISAPRTDRSIPV